jgi:hypothetical protein
MQGVAMLLHSQSLSVCIGERTICRAEARHAVEAGQ